MQTEKEIVAGAACRDTCPPDDCESALRAQKDLEARLSPERLELLTRTLKIRRLIGKISTNVAELVHEMREHGA